MSESRQDDVRERRVILDRMTTAEFFAIFYLLVALLACFVLGLWFDKVDNGTRLLWAVALLGPAIWAFCSTDCYWVVDQRQPALIYRRRWFGLRIAATPILPKQIKTVVHVIEPRVRRKGRGARAEDYKRHYVYIVEQSGRCHRVLGPVDSDQYRQPHLVGPVLSEMTTYDLADTAKEVARLLDVPCDTLTHPPQSYWEHAPLTFYLLIAVMIPGLNFVLVPLLLGVAVVRLVSWLSGPRPP